MAEYIKCRNCESPDCKGCNIKRLETMLENGKFDCMMNENRCINTSADVEPVQEWISVEDRLPKEDEIVIICTDKNFIYAGELIGDTWFLDNDSWTATVTHWMPLPQPPKGE